MHRLIALLLLIDSDATRIAGPRRQYSTTPMASSRHRPWRFRPSSFDSVRQGVEQLAVSGDPRAAVVIGALHDGMLYANDDHALFIQQPDGSYVDARTGKPGTGRDRRRREDRCASTTRFAVPSTRRSVACNSSRRMHRHGLQAAAAVFTSHDPAALPALDKALAKETDPEVKRRMEQAQGGGAAVRAEGERGRPAGGGGDAAGARRSGLAQPAGGAGRAVRAGGGGRRRRGGLDRSHPADLEPRAERLLRHQPGFRAAAGGGRPGDHLRRHGRHQHGARRDGDDRCLRDVRRPATDACLSAVAVRHQPADRRADGVPCLGRRRRRGGAQPDPLAVWPAAGDAAGDLGPFAGAAAGRPVAVWRQQPGRRYARLDERRVPAGRADPDLEPFVYHHVRVPGGGGADGGACATRRWACGCGRLRRTAGWRRRWASARPGSMR